MRDGSFFLRQESVCTETDGVAPFFKIVIKKRKEDYAKTLI